jgi:seryl-tRNA synthetase
VALSKTIPYWDVLERLDAVDMKRGQKLAGHRGYFLKGVGVKLAKALANLSLGFLEKEGYTLYETPLMVKEEFMR